MSVRNKTSLPGRFGNLSRRNILKSFAALCGSTAINIIPNATMLSASAMGAVKQVKLDVQSVNGNPAYNGVSPGLTIRALPGDTIDVDFKNSLSPLHDDCTDQPNNLHGRNTTNLHTHGLHVSPTTDSSGEFDADNVFVSVVPKDQLVSCSDVCGAEVKTSFRWGETKYRFELADTHTSGTYWYHAHKHGSTAQQVGAGLSGPLIIDDKPGTMPEYIEKAEEKILMIMNRGIVLANPAGGGETDPTLTMRPGEVQRWRIINATGNSLHFAFLRTNLENLEMYQIAYDGFTLDKRIEVDFENLDEPWLNPSALASGNRMDLIVRAPTNADSTGIFKSLQQSVSNLIDSNVGVTKVEQLNVEISGDPVEHPWSDDDALPGSGLKPFDETKLETRQIDFTRGDTIDNKLFNGETEQTMKLGTAEEWTIANRTGQMHVFHIHVNPFFITHINGVELEEGHPLRRWQDTLGMPLGNNQNPGTVTYKTRFEKFTGKFVIHCHVLQHEDRGMMQVVEVI